MGNLFVTEERIVEETEKIIQELIFGTIRETNKEKIDRIVAEHIIGGNVVSEYVIDSEQWDEAISLADMKKQMGM